MDRRTFLAVGGTATATALAGCSVTSTGTDDDSTSTDEETLVVATYSNFVDAPSDSPGVWMKEEFEARHEGVTLEWSTPSQEVNYFIERHNEGVGIDAEVYLGLRPHDLVRIDENTDGGLLTETDESALSHIDDVGEQYYFDPQGRVIPTYLSHAAMVYDGREVESPGSFDALVSEEYTGKFALSNPQEGTTGLLFLLWTIHEFGEDGYLEFWRDLVDNDARILDSWGDVYTQFQNDEVPVVLSYSNDRVYAKRAENDLDKHQVGFLDGQGYANMLGMARFADGTNDDLAHAFMDFVLEPEVQAVIAERNVTGPVNERTELPEVYAEYAQEPDEIVFFDYDELRGNLSGWVDEWGREIAGGR
ncbi:thiamine ABC transporter substrate-binding protein [Natronobiforma cellulositropha]|uniref:thiamine ABC transporter substrate-binding protein n=1 Tax=Natronobiforma cellulositropha TaxID=1679076 RepID=UPI0021D5FE43|nr:thiamine ABC transporter substrate-binding protein [Natronobiforma cellulositropha]